MIDKLKKIGPILGFALLVLMLVLVVKLQADAKSDRDALNKSMIAMKQLQDGIVRNQSQYVSKKDLDKFAKDLDLNLDAIRDDLDEFDAEVRGISRILASSASQRRTGIGSSWTKPRPKDPDTPIPVCPDGTPCPDPYGYLSNGQMLGLSEKFKNGDVPVGNVTFEAWKEKPWSIDIHARKYNVGTVIGQDEDGRHYVYNNMNIEVDGKRYKVPIEQAEFKEVYPEASFHFNPKLNLGIDVGAVVTDPRAELVPNVQVSMFSYGKTKVNAHTEWTFLGVGAGYGTETKTFNVVVSPVNYNLGQHIPLIEGLYVGPSVSVNTDGDFAVMGGLRVAL
jgi:hypothetical protein